MGQDINFMNYEAFEYFETDDILKFRGNKQNPKFILKFNQTFENFQIDLLILEFSCVGDWKFKFGYSIDNINYSEYKISTDFQIPVEVQSIPLYIAIELSLDIENIQYQLREPKTIYIEKNIDWNQYECNIKSIKYNDVASNLEKDFEIITYQTIINDYPKFNLYDNQKISVLRWLAQCNSVSEMYGHKCVYFKTEYVDETIVHTLANGPFRNVTNIKIIPILFPNNEIPQDRQIYTDWDIPLSDDVIIHVVKDKFVQAFGENQLPTSKDYLYVPLINKLFQVQTVQPKNGFMGVIGWWECFLAKYESDENIGLDKDLLDNPLFDESLFDSESIVIKDVTEYLNDTEWDTEEIDNRTMDEKSEATNHFSNRLTDTTMYTDVKETEKFRENYNKRLEIVSIKTGDESYSNRQIPLYNCTEVKPRVIALTYNLKDYTIKNRNSLMLSDDGSFNLQFNYVLLKKFSGELLDFTYENEPIFTLNQNRDVIEFINHKIPSNNKIFSIQYNFKFRELYIINLKYNKTLSQYTIKIYLYDDNLQTFKEEYQNIFICSEEIKLTNINKIYLYGGQFYFGKLIFSIDDNIIIKDANLPVLEMTRK